MEISISNDVSLEPLAIGRTVENRIATIRYRMEPKEAETLSKVKWKHARGQRLEFTETEN